MTRPNLQRATAISFGVHIFILIVALIILSLRPSIKSKHYTVRLVSPGSSVHKAQKSKSSKQPIAKKQVRRELKPKNRAATKRAQTASKPKQKKKPAMAVEKDPVPDRSAVKAKSSAIDRIREQKAAMATKQATLDKMREDRRLQDIRDARAAQGAAGAQGSMSDRKKASIMSAYGESIRKSIESNWIFPESSINVRAEVSITVFADGTMEINEIVTPSSNRAFDQSVLKAIKKTRTVDPPPFGSNENVILNFVPIK